MINKKMVYLPPWHEAGIKQISDFFIFFRLLPFGFKVFHPKKLKIIQDAPF